MSQSPAACERLRRLLGDGEEGLVTTVVLRVGMIRIAQTYPLPRDLRHFCPASRGLGKDRGPEAGRLRALAAPKGDPQHVGLDLEPEVAPRRAARRADLDQQRLLPKPMDLTPQGDCDCLENRANRLPSAVRRRPAGEQVGSARRRVIGIQP